MLYTVYLLGLRKPSVAPLPLVDFHLPFLVHFFFSEFFHTAVNYVFARICIQPLKHEAEHRIQTCVFSVQLDNDWAVPIQQFMISHCSAALERTEAEVNIPVVPLSLPQEIIRGCSRPAAPRPLGSPSVASVHTYLNHGHLAPRPRSAARIRRCLCRSLHHRVREWQRVRCRAHVHLERAQRGTRLWVRHSHERDHLQGPSFRVPRVVRVRHVPGKARPALHGSQHGRGDCGDQKHYSSASSFRLAVRRRVLCDLRFCVSPRRLSIIAVLLVN
jgi:hypothetical protein